MGQLMSAARLAVATLALPGMGKGRRLILYAALFVLLSSLAPARPATAQAPGIWAPAASLSEGRFGHTATLLSNGKVLVVGGVAHQSDILDDPVPIILRASAELYNPATDRWSSAGRMSVAREGHTATLLGNGKVLVVGGSGPSFIDATGRRVFSPLASVELYDPATNRWSSAAGLSTARAFHTASLLANGRVLVAGGMDNNGSPLANAEVYNPVAGSWSPAGSLGDARFEHTATVLANGQILVAGGRSQLFITNTGRRVFTPSASVERYDPATNRWVASKPMGQARTVHTATLLTDGRVLVAGGNCFFAAGCSSTAGLESAEVYDPATNSWAFTESMTDRMEQHAATLLRNGLVLVTGVGFAFPADQVYDPATNSWMRVGRPRFDGRPPDRHEHTATLLRNGKVLIAGGRTDLVIEDGFTSAIIFALPTTQTPVAVTSTETEEAAFAVFESTDPSGCIETFVSVMGGVVRRVESPPASPPPSPVPKALVSISQFDLCTGYPLILAFGDTEDADQPNLANFQTDALLSSATLTATVPMFDITQATGFIVSVNLTWTGTGDLIHQAGGAGGSGGSGHFEETSRLAQASGTVSDGRTNFTPAPSGDIPFCPECNIIQRRIVGGTFLEFR